MARIPLIPRVTLLFLNAFIVIAILFIVLFPTLAHTKSVYRPDGDTPTLLADPLVGETTAPNVLLQFQQPIEDVPYTDKNTETSRQRVDTPSRVTALAVLRGTLRVSWHVLVILGHAMSYMFLPLQVITVFIFNKLLFLLQPFIILATGVYTLTILWPLQLINYLTKTFYPLYVFLACASIIGLLVGTLANLTSSFLNNILFPHPPIPTPPSLPRPKTSDSIPESVISSGTITPAPFRVPPPSKFPSSTNYDPIHVLDTNALFTSFSLPIPPSTPPGILYSAPTPAGSVSGGVIGETIFEEEDDSDEKTPVVMGRETWEVGAGKPLIRPESADGRNVGGSRKGEGDGKRTWHGRGRREDVDAKGIDWGNDGIRKRKVVG